MQDYKNSIDNLKLSKTRRQARKSLCSNISEFDSFDDFEEEFPLPTGKIDLKPQRSDTSTQSNTSKTKSTKKSHLSKSTQKRLSLVNDIYWQMQNVETREEIQEITKDLGKKVDEMRIFKPINIFSQDVDWGIGFPDFLKTYDVHIHQNMMILNGKIHILNAQIIQNNYHGNVLKLNE